MYLVEFNNVRKAKPKEFSASEVDLDMSYITVGNDSLVSSNEEVALERVKIASSNDLRQIKVSYILFSFVLIFVAWRIVLFSAARESQKP
jgi:hypothetical protein